MTVLETGKRYAHNDIAEGKVALRFVRYALVFEDEYDEEGYEDTSTAIVIMVGDDREMEVDPEDLWTLAEDASCDCCGQVGCPW